MSGPPLRHALVAGGSIAGLLAARVLSDFFERVTLAERDTVASGADARRGVPQGRHIHALLARGREVLETLFPGIGEELRADGAVLLNGTRDVAWHHAGDWRVRYDGHLPILCMSRPLLEAAVARRLRALSSVALLDGTGIGGLTDDGNGSVTGTRIAGAAGEWRDIAADLVVDATAVAAPCRAGSPGWATRPHGRSRWRRASPMRAASSGSPSADRIGGRCSSPGLAHDDPAWSPDRGRPLARDAEQPLRRAEPARSRELSRLRPITAGARPPRGAPRC